MRLVRATWLLVFCFAGCTHQFLDRSTVLTTSTVMDIQYRTVLRNLAFMSVHPEAFPSHADLADGVVQVNDRLGFGQAGGFTTWAGSNYGFGLDQFSPSGQRQVTEQWGADATTDPQRLVDLQDIYRTALGLSPLAPPNAIAFLRSQQRQGDNKADRIHDRENSSDSSHSEEKQDENSNNGEDQSRRIELLPPIAKPVLLPQPSAASTGGGGSTPSGPDSGNSSEGRDRPPIELLLSDVPPPGWYCVGCKKDVPKDACYVGSYRDRYAWVTPEGIPALSRLTVTVLSVVKLKPDQQGKSNGLAVTTP